MISEHNSQSSCHGRSHEHPFAAGDMANHVVIESALGILIMRTDVLIESLQLGQEALHHNVRPRQSLDYQAPLLDAHRVAEQFNMDATWFLTRARENRIPHLRLGKYVRFDPDEIREFFHREAD